MNKLIGFFIALLLVPCFMACDKARQSKSFTVTCQFNPDSLARDSVKLSIVDGNGKRLIKLDCATAKNGQCRFAGEILDPHVAVLTFDSVNTPYYFILEPGQIAISFDTTTYHIQGGKQNDDLQKFLTTHADLARGRQYLHEQYVALADSGVLTLKQERQMALADSVLNDSLQHITVRFIQRNDAAASIVKEMFIGTLTRQSIETLKNK